MKQQNGRLIFANLIEPSILEKLAATSSARQKAFLEGMLGRCHEVDTLIASGRESSQTVQQARQTLRSITKSTEMDFNSQDQPLQKALVYALAPVAEDRAEFARLLAKKLLEADTDKVDMLTVSLIELLLHHFEAWKHLPAADMAELADIFATHRDAKTYVRNGLNGDDRVGKLVQPKSVLTPEYFDALAAICSELQMTRKPMASIPWQAFYDQYWDTNVSDEEAAASVIRFFREFNGYDTDGLRHALRGESKISTLIIKELSPEDYETVNEKFERFVDAAEKIMKDGNLTYSRLQLEFNGPRVVTNKIVTDGIARRLFRHGSLLEDPVARDLGIQYMFKNRDLIGVAAQEGIVSHEDWYKFFSLVPHVSDDSQPWGTNPITALMQEVMQAAAETCNASVFLAGQRSGLGGLPVDRLFPSVSWQLVADKEFPPIESKLGPVSRPTWDDIKSFMDRKGGWANLRGQTVKLETQYYWMHFLDSGRVPDEEHMKSPAFWEAADRIGWQKEEWHKKPFEFWVVLLDLLSDARNLGIPDKEINVLDLIRTAEATLT